MLEPQPPVDQIRQQILDRDGVLGVTEPRPDRPLVPSLVITSATTISPGASKRAIKVAETLAASGLCAESLQCGESVLARCVGNDPIQPVDCEQLTHGITGAGARLGGIRITAPGSGSGSATCDRRRIGFHTPSGSA